MDCRRPGLPVHHQLPEFTQLTMSLLKLMSIKSAVPSNHLILCRPLLLLPSIFPSIRVSSNESVLHIRWPKYWSFCFSISPSNEYSGLISYKIDWLDLLAVQGTLKSLLQHHSSKASILRHSAFFKAQLSHPYMTTGKTIASTRRTFVGEVMPLLFNTLSRLVITFLPRSKHLLVSWLQSPSAVILEPNKIKSLTVFIVCPSICHEVMGPDAMILVFWTLSFKPAFSLSSFTYGRKWRGTKKPLDESESGESEKVGLKLNIQKTKIMASGPITSWQIDRETAETVSRLYFWGLQNHCRWWLQPWN